jgi:hypothetical protein
LFFFTYFLLWFHHSILVFFLMEFVVFFVFFYQVILISWLGLRINSDWLAPYYLSYRFVMLNGLTQTSFFALFFTQFHHFIFNWLRIKLHRFFPFEKIFFFQVIVITSFFNLVYSCESLARFLKCVGNDWKGFEEPMKRVSLTSTQKETLQKTQRKG